MPKVAGKEHLQHRLYQTVTPLRRLLRQPRIETIRGERATFELDRHISELRVSTTGNQQFVWGKDLRDLKKLLQQEVQPPTRRRRKEHLQSATRQAGVEVVYHVFTDRKDSWMKSRKRANLHYRRYMRENGNARLYEERYTDRENEMMESENCLRSFGDYPM